MFRNKEFRQFLLLFFALTAILMIAGFVISLAAGLIATVSAVVFGTIFFVFTKARYRNIAKISKQIDAVLMGNDHFLLQDFEEGELSILHNDITKMTMRIRSQRDALIKDKTYLADSLADIAHQLRTPLTSANLVLSFLPDSTDAAQRFAHVREVESLLMRMDWLITALLKISRLDTGVVALQNSPIPMYTLLKSALSPLAIPMELRNIDLQIKIPEHVVIHGDCGWLSEAIENILKNCMESAGQNGKIQVVCNENVLYTELVIHDSGAGFAKEVLPYVFDRFYRGKNQSSAGYGIGLALAKMILNRQNASITASNHPDGGAVFSIRFATNDYCMRRK